MMRRGSCQWPTAFEGASETNLFTHVMAVEDDFIAKGTPRGQDSLRRASRWFTLNG